MARKVEMRPARAPTFGNRGMVVSGHSAASLAGLAAMKRGGNVVDAMVAASAVLGTVLQHATALGGDCFILFHEAKTGKTHGLNASGVAPALATPEAYAGGMDIHGSKAPVVPGLVKAWEVMHRQYGKLPWKMLFEEAIDIAQAFPVSKVLASRIPEFTGHLTADPGCAALYLPDGRALKEGDTLRQPALAATLSAIAQSGADGFYLGETAKKLDAYMQKMGGLIRASDLAAYEPRWVEPASATYRGHEVLVMPPNSYGLLLLMQLNGLLGVDQAALADPIRRLGLQMSAMKAAFEIGEPRICDPDADPAVVSDLLGRAATDKMQAAVRATAKDMLVPTLGGTSCLLLADGEGNAINVVQSVFAVFGSTFLDPTVGIMYNNRMQGFTHLPGKPNSVGPGKRPAHTLCPVMVKKDGKVRFVIASPGGLSQTLTNVQLINHLVDDGEDVATSVEAPRWCNTKGGQFLMEPGFGDDAPALLKEMGHNVKRADDTYYYGSAKAIELMANGNLAGAGDHRREAYAAGW